LIVRRLLELANASSAVQTLIGLGTIRPDFTAFVHAADVNPKCALHFR
jgi:hypothetical protein